MELMVCLLISHYHFALVSLYKICHLIITDHVKWSCHTHQRGIETLTKEFISIQFENIFNLFIMK